MELGKRIGLDIMSPYFLNGEVATYAMLYDMELELLLNNFICDSIEHGLKVETIYYEDKYHW